MAATTEPNPTDPDRDELKSDPPTGDDPDLTAYTVSAVMTWVNQRTGDERARRLARVKAIVLPD